MPFHPTTIFTLAYLLPLSLAHLPEQKTPFKLAIGLSTHPGTGVDGASGRG